MRKTLAAAAVALTLSGCAWVQEWLTPVAGGIDQGPFWTVGVQQAFYTQDQGSQIMPVAWMRALKQPDGQPFLADSLARYGYLPNPAKPASLLPIGFTDAARPGEAPMVGMTCSACHTREIRVQGKPYRIDGGPTFADFQSFLADLHVAAGKVAGDPAAFDAFAAAVLPLGATDLDRMRLRDEYALWYRRYDAIIAGSLPAKPWGPARLDAVAMIFNRLTGLDLGPAPDYLIRDNIQRAEAPVRYPFLWNAARQDKTQWPGFADNGNDVLALARNLGQVYGVFGTFHPVRDPQVPLLGVNYVGNNSANFGGLLLLEDWIKQIGPPRYPWPIRPSLADEGERIFNRTTAQGGCADCHGIRPGAFRFTLEETWKTPITPISLVQTDTRELTLLTRRAASGSLAGASFPFLGTIGATEPAFRLLGVSVLGSILQAPFQKELQTEGRLELTAPSNPRSEPAARTQERARALVGAFAEPKDEEAGYEARVLQGIWAAAPYLHNGSVPTLEDLLKPAAQRPVRFAVGPNYDIERLGLAQDQGPRAFILETTGCEDRNSGNSRCGHDYGTALPEAEKRALLEYLKRL